MGERTGVALIGAGHIATKCHLPPWSRCERARIVHIVDVVPERAEEAALCWDIPTWGTSLGAALEDERVAVVDICTPFEHHEVQAVAALEAGKHVFVEKPAATTAAQVGRIADAAEKASLVALTCENWAYSPAVSKARQLVDQGVIGTPHLFASEHFSGMSLPENPCAGVLRVPGSYLVNAGVHTINTSLLFMGKYAQVSAFAIGKHDVDLSEDGDSETVVAARFAGGGLGSMYFSGSTQCRRPGSRQIRIIGTRGRVEFDVFTGRVVWSEGHVWAERGVEKSWQDSSGSTGHPEAIDHFLDCIAGKAEPVTPVAAQVASHVAVDAIIESFETGQVIDVKIGDSA